VPSRLPSLKVPPFASHRRDDVDCRVSFRLSGFFPTGPFMSPTVTLHLEYGAFISGLTFLEQPRLIADVTTVFLPDCEIHVPFGLFRGRGPFPNPQRVSGSFSKHASRRYHAQGPLDLSPSPPCLPVLEPGKYPARRFLFISSEDFLYPPFQPGRRKGALPRVTDVPPASSKVWYSSTRN